MSDSLWLGAGASTLAQGRAALVVACSHVQVHEVFQGSVWIEEIWKDPMYPMGRKMPGEKKRQFFRVVERDLSLRNFKFDGPFQCLDPTAVAFSPSLEVIAVPNGCSIDCNKCPVEAPMALLTGPWKQIQ